MQIQKQIQYIHGSRARNLQHALCSVKSLFKRAAMTWGKIHTSTQITRSWISSKQWVTPPYHLCLWNPLVTTLPSDKFVKTPPIDMGWWCWCCCDTLSKNIFFIFFIYHLWQLYLLTNPFQPHLLTCDVDVDILMLMMSMVLLTMMKMARGPHLLTHPTPRREVAGSLKDFLLRPHPLPAAYLNYPKLHLSKFWNHLAAFIFLDSLQKYFKLLSHFWVADVPNAIVRQATAEQMGQSNC